MKGHVRERDQIQRDRENELIKLRISGLMIKDCAARLGVNRETVREWLCKDTYRLKFLKTRQKLVDEAIRISQETDAEIILSIEERIKSAAEKSLKRMEECLESENEIVVVKAASDLMDRDQRMSKTKKVQSSATLVIATAEQLILAAATAREVRMVGAPVEALQITEEMIPEMEPANSGS